jgi:hypothetical protein
LSGEVRGLKTKEVNVLTDTSALRRNTTFDNMLASCWLATTDYGPYVSRDEGRLDWSKVLVGDRFYTMSRIRVATFGPEYDFPVQCTAPACRERFGWSINLDEMPVKKFDKESLDNFVSHNRFEATLSDGTHVWFKLQVGADESKVARALRDRSRMVTASLAARIIEIENVHPNDRIRWIDDLDMADALALIDTFDGVDGGIETQIEVECTACGNIMDIELPFGHQFFMPRKGKLRL